MLADRPAHAPVDELALAHGVKAVLTLGDLEPAWLEGLDRLDLPKLGVRGNHDAYALSEFGIEDLHLRSTVLDGRTLAGFEGSPRYQPTGGVQYTQEQADALAQRLPAADVLLSHAPPAGVNDEPDDPAHAGFTALRAYVERDQPALLLHGHTEPRPGRATRALGPTRVVHVVGSSIVEL